MIKCGCATDTRCSTAMCGCYTKRYCHAQCFVDATGKHTAGMSTPCRRVDDSDNVVESDLFED